MSESTPPPQIVPPPESTTAPKEPSRPGPFPLEKSHNSRPDDFVDRFKTLFDTRRDLAGKFTIDVFPNMLPVIMFIVFGVNRIYPEMPKRVYAKTTASSVVAYCHALYVAHILLCDIRHRFTPSPASEAWRSQPPREKLLSFMEKLPVPKFMVPLLSALVPTTDPMRPNIQFCPSAAGFQYNHFYGRIFPVIMFTAIHDLITELASNTARGDVVLSLYRCHMYSVTNWDGNGHDIVVRLANLIGTSLPTAAGHIHYNSKLFQVMNSLFSPTLLRSYQKRDNLASLSVIPPDYDSRFMNPYDFMLSYTPQNASELAIVFDEIATVLKLSGEADRPLADFSSTFSGSDALSHVYTGVCLPSSHHSPYADAGTILSSTMRDPSTYAAGIHFMPNVTLVGPDTPDQATDYGPIPRILTRLARVAAGGGDTRHPTRAEYIRFAEELHVYPGARILEYTEASPIIAWKPAAFGYWVESYEIDGTSISVPNPKLAIGAENVQFADSAIPMRYCIPATSFNTDGAGNSAPRVRAVPPRYTRFAASSLMVDRTIVRLNQMAFDRFITPADEAGYFSGLTSYLRVYNPARAFSFFGFRTDDVRSHANADDAPPGVPTSQLYLWSYMTYTGYDDYADDGVNYAGQRTYFLSNPRTMFGTRHVLMDAVHPLEAMPVN